jgi:hypothetical protein
MVRGLREDSDLAGRSFERLAPPHSGDLHGRTIGGIAVAEEFL